MTSRDFCYWLQGLFELGKPATLDASQTDLVKRHLAMVFVHEIDPATEKGSTAMKALLDGLHSGQATAEPGPPETKPHGTAPGLGGTPPGCHHDTKFRC